MGCRGLKSKNYTIVEFNENLKFKILSCKPKKWGLGTKSTKTNLKYLKIKVF